MYTRESQHACKDKPHGKNMMKKTTAEKSNEQSMGQLSNSYRRLQEFHGKGWDTQEKLRSLILATRNIYKDRDIF